MSSADVGNFHAGFLGNRAGFDDHTLLKQAGLAEIIKRELDFEGTFSRWGQYLSNTAPYGDELRDFLFNATGIEYSKRMVGKL